MKDIQHLSDPTRGDIRIGTTEPITGFVSDVISRMSRTYPRMTYQVAVSDTTTLVRDLRERALDIVITRWMPGARADDLVAELLFEAPLAVMADRRHPLVGRKKLTLADLMDEQWTLSLQIPFWAGSSSMSSGVGSSIFPPRSSPPCPSTCG